MHQILHIIHPGGFSRQKHRCVQRAVGEHLSGTGAVGNGDDLLRSGKNHLVLAHDAAAAHSVNADLCRFTFAPLGVPVIYIVVGNRGRAAKLICNQSNAVPLGASSLLW